MNHEKITIKVLKCVIFFIGIIVVLVRYFLKENYVNFYMAAVNSASFAVSINILLIDLYDRFRKTYLNEHGKLNAVKTKTLESIVMISYLAIFVFEFVLIGLFLWIYFLSNLDTAFCNDALGIASLVIAISYDILNDVFVAIVLSFV